MWRLLKKLMRRKYPVPVDDGSEVIRIDDQGFFRLSPLIRTMKWRQSWRWDEIDAFGFAFTPAMFPDPWFGDYMESQWFFTAATETGPEHIYFDVDWLDIDHLPPALLHHMPGLNLSILREGLRASSEGLHNYKGEGRWIGWSRNKPPKPSKRPATRNATASPKKPKRKTSVK